MLAIPMLKDSKILLRCGFILSISGASRHCLRSYGARKAFRRFFRFECQCIVFLYAQACIFGSQAMQLTYIFRQVSVEVVALWLLLLLDRLLGELQGPRSGMKLSEGQKPCRTKKSDCIFNSIRIEAFFFFRSSTLYLCVISCCSPIKATRAM
jgi:hypothetical protein